MCGIAGIWDLHGRGPEPRILNRMIQSIRHRGPDDVGIHTEGGVGLAHARLSIIDLTGGHQPMSADNGGLWITFNGEIFNYLELRSELVRKGVRFSTNSDTEVILQQYLLKGERCVEDFEGQWAFAIWDVRQRKLFLSRDRVRNKSAAGHSGDLAATEPSSAGPYLHILVVAAAGHYLPQRA